MRLRQPPAVSEHISGVVERITFYSPQTNFHVVKLTLSTTKKLITVVGVTLALRIGESIKAEGAWIQDRVHGMQFHANSIQVLPPSDLDNIEKYLASGLIKGIGSHFAKRLVEKFKTKVFNIIESESHRLKEVEGIGASRQKQICESWKQQKSTRELILFLQAYRISTTNAVRIYKAYGKQSIQKIKENPYRLAREIYGIGFKTADEFARQLNISEDAPIRIEAGLQHILQLASAEGHCAMPLTRLESQTQALLEVSSASIQHEIEQAIIRQHLVKTIYPDHVTIASTQLYRTEQGIATQLKRLMIDSKPPWPQLTSEWVHQHLTRHSKIVLSDQQQDVLTQLLKSKLFIMTGGPGVGKTTVINNLLQLLKKTRGLRIALCAPTGRAAQRLAETTHCETQTIHRLLGFEPRNFGFKHDLNNPLELDLLIVDEASMLDVTLMYAILKAIPSQSALLLIGDSDQLPSVGPGRVLADLLETKMIPFARLTQIFRQATASQIIVNAHAINQGKLPIPDTKNQLSDFYFIPSDNAEDTQQKIVKLVTHRIPEKFQLDPVRDIQVLTPMNRGNLGAYHLNEMLQTVLNRTQGKYIERFGLRFMTGDKIIQRVNNYDKEIFNGDIGYILSIDFEAATLDVQFAEKVVQYDFNALDEINLAYAMTIHKSQGSEYPAVVIPMSSQHYRMLARNLLYTGVTRGKKLVILVGEKQAVKISVRAGQSNQRITQLKACIMQVFN